MKYRNELDFYYMDNYRALLACILAKNEMTIETAMYKVANERIGNIKRVSVDMTGRKHYAVPVKAIDVLENKTIKFNSSKEAALAIGVSRPTISRALNENRLVKKRWKFLTTEI